MKQTKKEASSKKKLAKKFMDYTNRQMEKYREYDNPDLIREIRKNVKTALKLCKD